MTRHGARIMLRRRVHSLRVAARQRRTRRTPRRQQRDLCSELGDRAIAARQLRGQAVVWRSIDGAPQRGATGRGGAALVSRGREANMESRRKEQAFLEQRARIVLSPDASCYA
jgi:hypothetical protein